MKKIIFGLFLILGTISFAVPDFVNLKNIEKVIFGTSHDDSCLSV